MAYSTEQIAKVLEKLPNIATLQIGDTLYLFPEIAARAVRGYVSSDSAGAISLEKATEETGKGTEHFESVDMAAVIQAILDL